MAADTAGHAADAGGAVEGGERICAEARDLSSLASAARELRRAEATGVGPRPTYGGWSKKQARPDRRAPGFHRAQWPASIRSTERGRRWERRGGRGGSPGRHAVDDP